MLTSPLLAYWTSGTFTRTVCLLPRSGPEPARASRSAERLFLRGQFGRRTDDPCRRVRTAEEVRLDLGDGSCAELDVTAACPLPGRRRRSSVKASGDVVGDDRGGRFPKQTRLGR